MEYKLEIACFNLVSAITAQKNGADRIELCDGFSEGGTTPDHGTVETARKLIAADLFIMIRPRGGDFMYSDVEFGQMKKEILYFKKMNVDGFVFGILDHNGKVDKKRNTELVMLCEDASCTFHRAFDKVHDMTSALEDVIGCGFKTILTSGTKRSAPEGIDELKNITAAAKGRITIMPGGGVRSSNIELLKKELDVEYYHSSGILEGDKADADEVKRLKELIK
jgi:copper homeostasis protein